MGTTIRRRVAAMLLLAAAVGLASCGGGSDDLASSAQAPGSEAQAAAAPPNGAWAAATAATPTAMALPSDPIAVTGFRRISRQALPGGGHEQVLRLVLRTDGPDVTGLVVTAAHTPAGTVVQDATVGIDLLRSGRNTVAADTLTLITPTSALPDLAGFRWTFESQGARTAVALDPTLPVALGSLVRRYVSPAGEIRRPGMLPLPPFDGVHESMVLAVDAAGVVWLAASTRAATTTLGADSTAAALARLLLTTEWGLEAGVVQLEAAVRATASYPLLVSEVASALAQGIAPAASPAVAAALAKVLSQAADALTPPQARPDREPALALSPDRLAAPYQVFRWPAVPKDLSVAVTSANSDRLFLRNSMPIAWEATTYGASSGRILGSAVLPGTDLYDVLLNNHPFVDVQARGGVSVNLKLQQSDASRRRTLADVATRVIKTALAFWKPGVCADSVVQVAVEAFVDGLTDLGSSDFRLFLNNTVGNYVAQFSLAQHCGSDRLHATAGPFIKVASTFVSALQPLNTAFTVPAQIALAIQFWNTSRDVAVCRSSSGGLAHCAQSLAFDPGVERITVGGVVLPMGSLRAYDAQDVETGVPAGLRFSTGQEGLILSSNPQSGAAIGLAVGTDVIRVRDPLTGATGRMTVHVVDPVIAPASANLEVDQVIGFSLQDAQGQPVTPPKDSRWTVDDPSVLRGPEPFFFYPQTALFTALRPGTARVTFTNAYDGTTRVVPVTVNGVQSRGTLDGSAPMAYRYCSGARMRVSGRWQIDRYGPTLVFNFLDGITQFIDASPCFTNTAVFRDTIVLSPVAGTDGGMSGSKRYPFVGDGGVEAATEVFVYVERRSDGSRRGLIRWGHHNASLVGQVETALVPLP